MRKTWIFIFAATVMTVLGVPTSHPQGAGTITGTVKVVGARTSADVIVYVEAPGKNPPAPQKHAVMDQMNQTFIPHVLPIVKGTAVDFPNSDKVRHNVYSPAGSAKPFNLGTYPAGVTKTMEFEKPGVVPLLCNVHTEMSAFILVLENSYFAVTDRTGAFTIKGVPPGKYTLKTWHERVASATQEVVVEAGKTAQVNLEMKGKKQ